MKLDRFTPRAVFFAITLACYSAGAYCQDIRANTIDRQPGLRFGQTIALSDFDSDGFVDEARLYGSGLHKRVGIQLSRSGQRISLHFGAKWINHGSLFARDLDEDGIVDLVWTDLIHPDSVVVWRGDGRGTFERNASLRVGNFALETRTVTAPSEVTQETSINFENDRSLGLALSGSCPGSDLPVLNDGSSEISAASSPSLDQPADRGPPFLSK